jgi:hypothetical protein
MFILIEKHTNGIVSLGEYATGFDFPNFHDAVEKCKKTMIGENYRVLEDNDEVFSYVFDAQIPLYGMIKNKQLTVISK